MKTDKKTFVHLGIMIFLLYLGIHYWSTVVRYGRLLLSAATPLFIGCELLMLLIF